MASVPETKPCDHSDCGGTMHLKTGADPTMQGTSQGRQSGTVLYVDSTATSGSVTAACVIPIPAGHQVGSEVGGPFASVSEGWRAKALERHLAVARVE